jgi:hypothetical protein
VDITGHPEGLFMMMQLMLLSELHPELFENGFRLREGVTMEKVRQVLLEDPRLEGTYKLFVDGAKYTTSQAAAGVIDMTCHIGEAVHASNSLEMRAKVAKQVARSVNIFTNAMGGTDVTWRNSFTPAEIAFMQQCAILDRAKIDASTAENARVQFLFDRRDWDKLTDLDQQEYARIKAAAEEAKANLKVAEQRVMSSVGGESEFITRAVEIQKKQAQVAHRAFVLDVMDLPVAERARALAEYESELTALLEHYGQKADVPEETMEWARKALESTQKLSEINRNNAEAMEGSVGKLKRVLKMFDSPINTRENAKLVLGKTAMGRALLEKIPEWAFANEKPPSATDIAFESPVNFVAEAVVAPVNTTVNALMMIDMMLQVADVWSSNQTDTQKVMSTAGIVSLLVVPHLYLVPAFYHASLTGDPKQVTYVLACFICPPAMLPMLVESFGARIVSGARHALFQSELEAMWQASTFDPASGQEPKTWAENRDLVHYQWKSLDSQNETYGRGKERNLATFIKILASDDREDIPLTAKNMTGLGALLLPGGVAKSFRSMIQDGEHKLFRENEALASAMAALQKYNCDRVVSG